MMQTELLALYNNQVMMKTYCIFVFRGCNSGIKDYELKEAYEIGILSELYPGVALARNTVFAFFKDLGKTCSRIVKFMKNRTAAVAMDHHFFVDRMLKSDNSKVNPLSELSYKARTSQRFKCMVKNIVPVVK